MSKFAGFLSGIAGIAVLVGNYVGSLNGYYLIPIGGVLALIAAAISMRRYSM